MKESNRFSGFLTPKDKEELNEMETANEKNRHARHRIRQRAARAIHDIAYLERELPPGSDRQQIFDAVFSDSFHDWGINEPRSREDSLMTDIFSLLFSGFVSYYNNVTEGDGLRPVTSSRIEQWIKGSTHGILTDGYVDTTLIPLSRGFLDQLQSRFYEDPDSLTYHAVLTLFKANRITEAQRSREADKREKGGVSISAAGEPHQAELRHYYTDTEG